MRVGNDSFGARRLGARLGTLGVVVLVCVGIAASIVGGLRLNDNLERQWRARAEHDAWQSTRRANMTLEQAEAMLGTLGVLFRIAPEDVDAEILWHAQNNLRAQHLDFSFDALAFLRVLKPSEDRPADADEIPADVAGLHVIVSTARHPALSPGGNPASLPAVVDAIERARARPGVAVISRAFRIDGRWRAVMAREIDRTAGTGVLLGLMNLDHLFEIIEMAAPAGLVLRVRESSHLGQSEGERLLHGARANPDAVTGYNMFMVKGGITWEFLWDLLPAYAGGPGERFGGTVMLSGSLLSLLVGLLVGTLLRRNAKVRARVLQRTAELARTRDEAEQANRAKTDFLAVMSHELRTPLNAILGFSEIIKGELHGPLGSPKYRDYAEDIHSSGSHLLALINDILDVAKAEAGRLELCEDEVPLDSLFEEVVRLMTPRANEAAVALALELPQPAPVLTADRRRIRQILINLLSNAVKFTEPGGQITTGVRRRPNGGLRLFVEDSGIGMDPADIPQALAPFRQLDSALDRKFEGTGLGLPLCQRLAQLHDAPMTIDSLPGRGTRVMIDFPPSRVVTADIAVDADPPLSRAAG